MSECSNCQSKEIEFVTSYQFYDVIICKKCEGWSRQSLDDCCREPNMVYVFDYKNGCATHIREQCLACGGCLNMTKPLSRKQHSDKINLKYSFSRDRYDDYKKEKEFEANLIYVIQKRIRYEKSNYYKYLTHLLSSYWKSIRQRVLKRDNAICQECLVAEATQVHHLTYENLGNEQPEDLVSLCSKCHMQIHGIDV